MYDVFSLDLAVYPEDQKGGRQQCLIGTLYKESGPLCTAGKLPNVVGGHVGKCRYK